MASRPIPNHALCIGCGYSLRDLTVDRCPECGREFDPVNAETMNLSGREFGPWARRLLRPPMWPAVLAACGLGGWTLWLCRLPGPIAEADSDQLGWAWGIAAGLGVVFVVVRYIVTAGPNVPSELHRGGLRRWWVPVLISLGALLLAKTSLPFHAAFCLSRPWLDRAAQRMLNDPPRLRYAERTMGLFPANSLTVTNDAVVFQIQDEPSHRWYLVCRPPSLPMSLMNWADQAPQRIGGSWYLCASGMSARDVSSRLRWHSMAELAAGDPKARAAVPMLLESLREPAESVEYDEHRCGLRPFSLPRWLGRGVGREYVLRPDMVALVRLGADVLPELRQALQDPDARLRQQVCFTLARIGPDAAPAVPDLVRLLADPDPAIREAAACALGYIGPAARQATPALLAALLDANAFVRYNAIVAVERVGVDAESAVPTIIAALRAPFGPTTAPSALWGSGNYASPGFLLTTSQENVLAMVRLLGRFGPKAGAATPLLVKALEKPAMLVDPGWTGGAAEGAASKVTQEVIGALRSIGPSTPDVSIPLIDALEHELAAASPNGAAVQRLAQGAAAVAGPDQRLVKIVEGRVGGAWSQTQDALRAVLHEISPADPLLAGTQWAPASRPTTQEVANLIELASHGTRWAVNRLGDLGPAGADAVPALASIVAREDSDLRGDAAIALGKIGPAAAAAVPALVKLLSTSNYWFVCEALGKIGPAAYEQAAPALLLRLRNEADADALAKIGVGSEDLVARLIAQWPHLGKDESRNTLRILARIGPVAAKAMPQVQSVLAVPELSGPAWEVLDALGPDARDAVPAMVAAIRKSAGDVRVLAKTGVVNDQVIELLTAAMDSDYTDIRVIAARRLGEIGPRAAAALPALDKRRWGDMDDAVRATAAEAIALIRGAATRPATQP